jgi:hypothetical protein
MTEISALRSSVLIDALSLELVANASGLAPPIKEPNICSATVSEFVPRRSVKQQQFFGVSLSTKMGT